jgi:hypothetical protein
MGAKLSFPILFAGLLAAAATQSGRADPATPDATLKLKGDAAFDFEQRRTPEDCGPDEGWSFKFDTKSTEFKFAWRGDGLDRRFFALKVEVWRVDESEGCYVGSSVERMDVTAFEPSKSGQANPLYTLSITPESHDQFADLAIVEASDSFLKIYAGESLQESDFASAAGPYRYYDLRNGKLLFFADQRGLVAERGTAGLGDSDRLIGMTVPRQEDAYVASIVYASRSGILQRAQVRLASGASLQRDQIDPDIGFLGTDAPRVSFSHDTIRSESEVTAISLFGIGVTRAGDFEIRFTLGPGAAVTVPMSGDKLDFTRARLPVGLVITPIE